MTYHIMIRFGHWVLWRTYPSRRAARRALRYWRERMSWPLKLERDTTSTTTQEEGS